MTFFVSLFKSTPNPETAMLRDLNRQLELQLGDTYRSLRGANDAIERLRLDLEEAAEALRESRLARRQLEFELGNAAEEVHALTTKLDAERALNSTLNSVIRDLGAPPRQTTSAA